MAIKELFGKQSNKLVTAKEAESIANEVESKDFVRAEVSRRNTFIPRANFNEPKNFVKHGSAEKYYVDSIENIYKTFPYDGSEAEQVKWHNSASYLDNYLFDNGYPRTTGYVLLNSSYSVDTTLTNPSESAEVFKINTSPQYIKIKGGPRLDPKSSGLVGLFGDSKTNVYKTAASRSSNLNISHELGNTVEFWYKVKSTSSFLDQSTCIFDLWNGDRLDSDSYGRMMIEVLGTGSSIGTASPSIKTSTFPGSGSFTVTYASGSTGATRIDVGPSASMPQGWLATDWHHYAFTFKSNTTDNTVNIKFYVDGNLITATTSSIAATTDGPLTGSRNLAITSSVDKNLIATLGAYRTAPIPSATSSFSEGYGTYENTYFDEFRFWKKARTEKEIKRNWFKQVRGGVNTDDANINLGVYYKFNEGIIGTSSMDNTDAVALDYSGRITNGTIENYSLGVRYTSSALTNEYEDPIIYSRNPRVDTYTAGRQSIGQAYDLNNHTSIVKSIPKWITDMDEKNNSVVLNNLVQIMASYFDTLQLQIEALPRIKDVHYPTRQSGSYPYHFVRDMVGSMGIINPDLFINANVIEEIVSRDEVREFSENIQTIKNVIYQNIYNNLPYIFKSKGTEKSFRNLIRCFGIDDELLKVNMYANDVDFTFDEDNIRYTSYKKQYVNFNNTASFEATVYQYTDSGNSDSVSYMAGRNAREMDYIPYTYECEVYFPRKYSTNITDKFPTSFVSSSLFGMHEAKTSDTTELTWTGRDAGNFQVYFIREDSNSQNGYFRLEFSGSVNLTSSIIYDVYDNEKWNLAVRLKPSGALSDLVPGSPANNTYQLEFYGVNSVQNIVQNEFLSTASIADEAAKVALNAPKRIYIGAHRTNFTGSVLKKSDVNISSVRFWNDYLDNQTMMWHSYDASSHGRLEPYKPAFFTKTSLTGSGTGTDGGNIGAVSIPQIETLALHWNFQNLTGSDNNGSLTVSDYTSGSSTPYGWYSDIRSKFHTGKGYNFPASYLPTIRNKYINIAKISQPETLNNSDMVNVLAQDDEIFTRDTVPIKHYFAAEKSMYQIMSDEMIKIFAGLRYFNDLVGHPINRYRMEYKDLRKLRQLFFNNVESTPSLEKFVEFYKWIDSTIGDLLNELIPASANFSENIRTMVESHMLERNKYWNKFPTIESKNSEPIANIRGINELLYDWEHGHSLPKSETIAPSGVKNILFNKERAIRTDVDVSASTPAAGSPLAEQVNDNRETIRKAAVREVKGDAKLISGTETDIQLYDNTTSALYEASTYATRRLSRPYHLKADINFGIKGGVNFHPNKLPPFEFIRTATSFPRFSFAGSPGEPGSPSGSALRVYRTALEGSSAVVNNNSQDESDRFYKFKADSDSKNTNAPSGSVNSAKGSLLNPYSEYSETVTGTPKIVNNLFDTYGKDKETPMQGPFTDTHVGGSQHRHTDLNRLISQFKLTTDGSASVEQTLDNNLNRAELYVDEYESGTTTRLAHPSKQVVVSYGHGGFGLPGVVVGSGSLTTIYHVPFARYFRDETAKRPVNIRNIKYTTSSFNLGNYNRDYQIISTTGRSVQNRWLVKNEGKLPNTGSITSNPVPGIKDFRLPDRTTDRLSNTFGRSRHVIAQRFSSPGGTDTLSRRSMDAESEEYSPYNSLNYRNLIIRQFLNSKQNIHCGQYGFEYDSTRDVISTTGSFHKVQRNPRYRIQLTGSGTSHIQSQVSYDTFYVTHAIPRSEYQYAWITASALVPSFPSTSSVSEPFRQGGFSSKYTNVSHTASFVLSGSLYAGTGRMDIDFAGLNTTIYDPISLLHSTTGYPNIYDGDYAHKFFADTTVSRVRKEKELNALLLHRDGPYQYPSWKQTRTSERPLVRKQKKSNIISVKQNDSIGNRRGARTLNEKEAKVSNFYEPVVTWNKPITSNFGFTGIEGKPLGYKIRYAFSNNVEMFANPNLTNRVNLYNLTDQAHESLTSMYKDPNLSIDFSSIQYDEFIFPKHRNVGFEKTRKRKYYTESEDTLRKSPATIKTFWRDRGIDRIKPNRSSNALDTKFSIPQINEYKQLDSFWALDNFKIQKESNIYEVLGDLAYVGTKRYDAWITNGFKSHEESSVTGKNKMGDFRTGIRSRGQIKSPKMTPRMFRKIGFDGENIAKKKDHEFPSKELIKRNTFTDVSPELALAPAVSFNDHGDSIDLIDVLVARKGKKRKLPAHREERLLLNIKPGDGSSPVENSNTDMISEGGDSLGGSIMTMVSPPSVESLIDKGYTARVRIPKITSKEEEERRLKSKFGGKLAKFIGVPTSAPPKIRNPKIPNPTVVFVNPRPEPGLPIGSIPTIQVTSPAATLEKVSTTQLDVFDLVPLGELDKIYDVVHNSDGHDSSDNIFKFAAPFSPTTILLPERQALPPRPAIQFIFNPHHSLLSETGWEWKTAQMSGKKPWYDTYKDYSVDTTKVGPNFGIIPEFRISKHMDFYVQKNHGDFRSENYSFLTLDGGGNTTEPQHDSARKIVTFKKSFSRDGGGAFDIPIYPTSSTSVELMDVQNNAWYERVHPDGDASYTYHRNYNNAFAAGTFGLDNSVMTLYNITKTNPSTGKNSSGTAWKSIAPYQTQNAAVMLNTKIDSRDYLVSTLEKVNRDNTGSISLQEENSTGDEGTPFCISFWANLDSSVTNKDYVGAWNLSMGEHLEQWCGLWLKCPKAKDWGGTTGGDRGITFFMNFSGSHPETDRTNADVNHAENVYEFFNSDGTEAKLSPGTTYNIVFEYVPRGTTDGRPGSPPYIRMFLNGSKLYGKHIRYANEDSGSVGVAYSACPVGATGSWNDGIRHSGSYGHAVGTYGYNRLSRLEIGKSNPHSNMSDTAQWFHGAMDEFSMWYGTLTSDDVTRLNYYGHPSNLIEEYANSEIVGTTSSWEGEFGNDAPTIGTDARISYTIPTSSFTFRTLDLFQWNRLGIPYSTVPEAVQVDYDDVFFNQYAHTDVIKHFGKITKDYKDIGLRGAKTKLRLKINAVKKFLPYNGFYPSQRAVQLAYLFKESYRNSISLTNPNPPYNKEGLHPSQAFQSLLQPFFAPGLLFNTIKSGLAVDFPIFRNDSGLEPYKPLPYIDAFDDENSYIPKRVGILAPSWYCKLPENYSGKIVDVDKELPLRLENGEDGDALQELKKSQPKYNLRIGGDSQEGATGEGFIIIKEPSARLGFEKLLDVESAFFTEGSLNHETANPTDPPRGRMGEIFQNVIIEIQGSACEWNTITLKQPIISTIRGFPEVVSHNDLSVRIKHDETVPPNEVAIDNGTNEATFRIDFNSNDEAVISKLVSINLVDWINSRNDLHFVAVNNEPIFVPPGSPDEFRNIGDAFRRIEDHVTLEELKTSGATSRVKIIYTGPLVLTYEDILDLDKVDLNEELIKTIVTIEPSLRGKSIAEVREQISDIEAHKKFYFGTLEAKSQVRHEGTLFSRHNESRIVNGFGDECKITLSDTFQTKQDKTLDGLLGIKYVSEQGSVDNTSDQLRTFLPMLQMLRLFYGGRPYGRKELIDDTSLGDVRIKKKPHQIFFMAPSYYTGSIDSDWTETKRYPSFEWTGKTSNPLYRMAMHNFLAETPKFFLKNKGMTTLVSAPKHQHKTMVVGKKYYMDIVMYKTDNFDMTVSPFDGQTFTMRGNKETKTRQSGFTGKTQGRYYGPAFKYKNTDNYTHVTELIQDPAYAPYTPPYFYGRTIARVSYTADRENPSIDDIHTGMVIEHIEDEAYQKFMEASVGEDDKLVHDPKRYTIIEEKLGIKDSPAFKAKMNLEASINFRGKTRVFLTESGAGSPLDDAWLISTKFECPMLNFNPAVTDNSASFALKLNEYAKRLDGEETRGTGMWHGYGEIPTDEGVFLSLEESFTVAGDSPRPRGARIPMPGDMVDQDGELVGSLIDACGFEVKGPQKLGELAEERKVSEAVIMVPFIDTEGGSSPDMAPITNVINKKFFTISKGMFALQKSNVEQGKPAIGIGNFGSSEEIQETSISRMIRLMKKYYIPPKLDFLNYDDQDPFVMYVFEFNHTFSKQDLSDMWQGLIPKMGECVHRSGPEDDNEIIHDLGQYDFFEGKELPENVRWLMFKVKQKGEKNYYNMLPDKRQTGRYNFDFGLDIRNPDPLYSYNWPYDFFSFIELAQVEGGIVMEPRTEADIAAAEVAVTVSEVVEALDVFGPGGNFLSGLAGLGGAGIGAVTPPAAAAPPPTPPVAPTPATIPEIAEIASVAEMAEIAEVAAGIPEIADIIEMVEPAITDMGPTSPFPLPSPAATPAATPAVIPAQPSVQPSVQPPAQPPAPTAPIGGPAGPIGSPTGPIGGSAFGPGLGSLGGFPGGNFGGFF